MCVWGWGAVLIVRFVLVNEAGFVEVLINKFIKVLHLSGLQSLSSQHMLLNSPLQASQGLGPVLKGLRLQEGQIAIDR